MATNSRTRLKTVQTPFYATVGVTDLAVGAVREYVADVQTRVRGYQKDASSIDPKALREVPAKVATLVDDNVSALGDTYVDLVKRGEGLVGRIRRQQSTQATVRSAETTVSKAKTTRTQTTKGAKATTKTASTGAKATTKAASTGAKKATTTAKKRSTAPRSSAKATTTAAKKTASSATRAVTDAAQKVGD